MKIISSQHFLNWEKVEEKIEQIKGMDVIEIPCCEYMDGDWYDVQKSNPAEEKFSLIW